MRSDSQTSNEAVAAGRSRRLGRMARRLALGFVLWFAVAPQVCCAADAPCRIVKAGTAVELGSPHFVLRLDTAAGLQAQSWLNRRTGRTISLGGGPELRLEIGDVAHPKELKLRVTRTPEASQGDSCRAVFELTADRPGMAAVVAYEWNAGEPVLRKTVEVSNSGPAEVRLLNVSLADYKTDAKIVTKEQGFPAYLND